MGTSTTAAAPRAVGIRATLVDRPDATLRANRATTRLAVALGLIFVVAGLAKFVLHGWELAAFRRFEMPAPEVTVLVIGALEVLGGVLLTARRAVAPVALLEAAIMVGAIAVSGIGAGDVIPSLTLAPALLVALLVLLARVGRVGRDARSVGRGGARGAAQGAAGGGAPPPRTRTRSESP